MIYSDMSTKITTFANKSKAYETDIRHVSRRNP